jgi:hypothetical protein
MVLGAADLEQFIERGHCRVDAAFDRADATAVCDLVYERMHAKAGIVRTDASTWPQAYDIEEHLTAPVVRRCFSDRVAIAIEQLVGKGRWTGRRDWGLWPVNFRWQPDGTTEIPDCGWHVDGNWFRHTVDCPKQGLLVIGIFTDLDPGGGGTVLAEGSHRRAIRILARHPEGLAHRELFDAVLEEPIGGFHEITGRAGDVILAHPLLFHTRGTKRSGPPRILSNTEAPLLVPIEWNRPPHERSPLEDSIVRALHSVDAIPTDAMQCRF